MQQERRSGSTASRGEKMGSPCQQDDTSMEGYSGPELPEDILCHIHSLMPMRDAARTACVSRAFERSWRSRPNLTFSWETLGIGAHGMDEMAIAYSSIVDCILKKHSGIGVKTLDLRVVSDYNDKESRQLDHLDSWLQIAVTPGIQELSLYAYSKNAKYNFPCSLLSDGTGDSLQHLFLSFCDFHPTVGHGCLRNLTRLHLSMVRTTDAEMGCLLSNTFALENLELNLCSEIIWLKIPCLQRLSYLSLSSCIRLQVIEGKTPNLSNFRFIGHHQVQLSLGETLRLNKLHWSCPNSTFYARTELPSIMPNLETLSITSTSSEIVDTPMMPSKLLHLKSLTISLGHQVTPDYFSLVSFLHASPLLETFILVAQQGHTRPVSFFMDPWDLRRMPEQFHDKLKRVSITTFTSAKSLVELSCHILEFATSLKRFRLDTTRGRLGRCSDNISGKCFSMHKDALREAQRALLVAETFIKPKVPSTVEFKVLEPCSRCHAVELWKPNYHC
ncbi:hypothetical protein ACP70R_027241 [Stipagrostis hirtigluma subsp. patula]